MNPVDQQAYLEALKRLPDKAHRFGALNNLLLDLMDWYEQSDEEAPYIGMQKLLEPYVRRFPGN